MTKMTIAALFAVFLCACTDDPASKRALESAGYEDIHTKGWAPFTCGEGDTYSTKFEAKNPKGTYVDGVVCCGVMKGCTIRFD